jgi:hypothetical protein
MSRRRTVPGFAAAATLISLLACYGTLAVVATLGSLGVAIALDETLWAGVIVGFAALAAVGLAFGWRRHRRPWPPLLGLAGAAVIAYVMVVQYDRVAELAGFALLGVAALWDWLALRRKVPT